MATLAVTLVFSLYKKIFSSAANAENPLTFVVVVVGRAVYYRSQMPHSVRLDPFLFLRCIHAGGWCARA